MLGRQCLSPESGMCFYCRPVSGINWQLLLRKQSEQLPTSMPAHENFAGIRSGPCYLRLHVRASMWLLMPVFSQKARGSWNRLDRATHTGPLSPAEASNKTAKLPFASLVLAADPSGEAQRPVLFFPQTKLSPPVLRKYKLAGWKKQWEQVIFCSTGQFVKILTP